MIAQLIDVRNLFGIADTEKSDGEVGAALGHSEQQIIQMFGRALNGQLNREFIGMSDGSTVEFLTGFNPVLDKLQITGGIATNDSTKLTLESKAVGASSYSTISSSTYTIDGDKGLITFSTLPAEGSEIYATYYYDTYKVRYVEAAYAAFLLTINSANSKERGTWIYSQYADAMSKRPFYKEVPQMPQLQQPRGF